MSDDLISRSVLLKEILKEKTFLQKGLGKDAEYAYMPADFVMHKINSQPTAYDVDKVVQQLMKESYQKKVDDEPYVMLDDTIEIVKSGGVANG